MTRNNAASDQVRRFADDLIDDFRKIEPLASLGYFESGSYGVSVGVDGLSYGSNWALRLTPSGGNIVRLYISDPNADRLASSFATLLSHRNEIESLFGDNLHFWPRTYGAAIQKFKRSPDGKDERNWPLLRADMIDRYCRLRDAIDPFLPEIAHV